MRRVNSFAVGQISAAYDEEGMPRKYAQVFSVKKLPFSLGFSWLIPAPLSTDERQWLTVGLPVACGYFELETEETITTEEKMFSHLVFCLATLPPGPIVIQPKEHEIWAIYKDWNPWKWCNCTLQIVEIVANNSSTSVLVVGL